MLDQLRKTAHNLAHLMLDPIADALIAHRYSYEAPAQKSLMAAYAREADSRNGEVRVSFADVGFGAYSQTDEDGILLYLFSVLGVTSQRCVELGAGNGIDCNCANLLINHGWDGLLMDGNQRLIDRGRKFYARHRATRIYPPTLVTTWITRENVNDLLVANSFEGEMDLLSIDVDGIDYWLWDAIDAISPRVIVIEFQDIIGPELALTIPYAPDFDAYQYPTTNGMPNFCGASLSALKKLGDRKGYRLVGCNRLGFNAFFVRNDVGPDIVPRVDVAACFEHAKVREGMRSRFPTVANLPWVEV